MALRILDNQAQIRRAQRALIEAFRDDGAETVKTTIGYRGGETTKNVLWHRRLGMWCALERRPEDARYWNPFGLDDPNRRMVSITCEINMPKSGIDRRTGGAIAVDEANEHYLVHRGKIGGGRVGIGRNLFLGEYVGKRVTALDGDRTSEFALVGKFGHPRFLSQVRVFVQEIQRIKGTAEAESSDREGASDGNGSGPASRSDIGNEFAGRKAYHVNRTIEANCDHGLVANRLRELLTRRGHDVGKDVLRDLFVRREGSRTSVFEIKSSTDTQSVYSAVGQLFVHSVGEAPRPNLYFVAPVEGRERWENPLKDLGIQYLPFDWDGDRPRFRNLTRCDF